MKIGFPVYCFGLSLCILSCNAPVVTSPNGTDLPQNTQLDSIPVPGKAFGDFAPFRIGNSWTYRDSIVTCPGLLSCTATVESIAVVIQDIFDRNDTTFFRLSAGSQDSSFCFEKGNAFYNISALTGATPALGCSPLLYHDVFYNDSISDRFVKMDILGKSTWIVTTTDTLHYSPSTRDYPQDHFLFRPGPGQFTDFRLARGLGVISYHYSVILGSLTSPTSRDDYLTLIGADLH
ncbi:MAG: hypothetical protein JF616_06260 [Fibrobacteres bacterium]|nr:hypothetical protein [Fibrobacterota bacterium]